MTLVFDHLVISAATLDEGAAWVEAALGVALVPGGQHPHMATYNRLLGLGDLYLEVIAADPGAPAPPHPRWFDLDRFAGRPRITNWAVRCDDLAAELALSPAGAGEPLALSRGDFTWQVGVTTDGCLPMDGAFPALIQWTGPHHPVQRLPESGIRLTRLDIAHPDGAALSAHLAPRLADDRLAIASGPAKAMRATFATPNGVRVLA